MLMQQFLPIKIRSIMHPPTRAAINRELYVTLCLLEKQFPPSFFDVMIHLTVHLTREVIKGHMRNKNKPEDCIAGDSVAEETIEFF
uniref:DUF4218 domain-containing protein n=1 Tax=Lactuca sativa TaxID=4236 RepID=A0A9R1WF69_LACSA|nr:hypothetical protein LSAT_V11C100004950 [Lactuca sativa]